MHYCFVWDHRQYDQLVSHSLLLSIITDRRDQPGVEGGGGPRERRTQAEQGAFPPRGDDGGGGVAGRDDDVGGGNERSNTGSVMQHEPSLHHG